MDVITSLPASTRLADVPDRVRRIEDLGFDTIHVSETVRDPFSVCALALEHSTTLVVRTSMVVAFARSPMVTACSAWELARYSGGRFQLGIATQVRGNIVGRFSMPWTDPAAQLRDYVESLRAIFAAFAGGQSLDHHGSHYTFTRLQPYFNPGPIDMAPPPIWTGGVNRRMCTLAGAVADGFVAHPTSSHPAVLREYVLPALADGAAKAGRTERRPAPGRRAARDLRTRRCGRRRRPRRTAFRTRLPVLDPRVSAHARAVRIDRDRNSPQRDMPVARNGRRLPACSPMTLSANLFRREPTPSFPTCSRPGTTGCATGSHSIRPLILATTPNSRR